MTIHTTIDTAINWPRAEEDRDYRRMWVEVTRPLLTDAQRIYLDDLRGEQLRFAERHWSCETRGRGCEWTDAMDDYRRLLDLDYDYRQRQHAPIDLTASGRRMGMTDWLAARGD